jgi:hypothetical protein
MLHLFRLAVSGNASPAIPRPRSVSRQAPFWKILPWDWGLESDYVHQIVNHAEEYVRGNVHTNGMENSGAFSSVD